MWTKAADYTQGDTPSRQTLQMHRKYSYLIYIIYVTFIFFSNLQFYFFRELDTTMQFPQFILTLVSFAIHSTLSNGLFMLFFTFLFTRLFE